MRAGQSWYNVAVDFLYFAFLWWAIPIHLSTIVGMLVFLLLSQLWAIFRKTATMEFKYKIMKSRYASMKFLVTCFILRAITVIPFLVYGQYVMAGLQALVMITFWWLYQRVIITGQRMGLR